MFPSIDKIEELAARMLLAEKYAELYPERVKDRAKRMAEAVPPFGSRDEKQAIIDALEG